MILQDHRLAIPKNIRNAFPFLAIQDHAAEIVVDGVRFVETDGVLRYHVQGLAEDGPRFAVHAVGVAGGVDVRTETVYLGVDCEGGGVDGFVADDYVAVFVYEDEV